MTSYQDYLVKSVDRFNRFRMYIKFFTANAETHISSMLKRTVWFVEINKLKYFLGKSSQGAFLSRGVVRTEDYPKISIAFRRINLLARRLPQVVVQSRYLKKLKYTYFISETAFDDQLHMSNHVVLCHKNTI